VYVDSLQVLTQILGGTFPLGCGVGRSDARLGGVISILSLHPVSHEDRILGVLQRRVGSFVDGKAGNSDPSVSRHVLARLVMICNSLQHDRTRFGQLSGLRVRFW